MKIPKGKKNRIKFKCNICKNLEYLISHHINGREIHNANKKWNLVDICVSCHDKVHKNEIIIEGWSQTTDGRILLFHKNGEENFSGMKADVKLFGQQVSRKTQ